METLAVPEAVVDRGSSKAPLGALRLARIATVQEHVARAHIRRRHESPWNVELLAASVVASGHILKSANLRGPIVELREPDGGVIFAHLPVQAGPRYSGLACPPGGTDGKDPCQTLITQMDADVTNILAACERLDQDR